MIYQPPALIVLLSVFLSGLPAGGRAQQDSVYCYAKDKSRHRVACYPAVREVDVMWSKRVWRTIDLREKFNHPLYYPETPVSDRKNLFDVIKDGIFAGEIYAFDNPYFDDEFKVRMSEQQLVQLFFPGSSTREKDTLQGGFLPVPAALTSKAVKQYWIKEDWFFDKQRSVMDVRIIGLCPLKEKSDPSTGQVIGAIPLFWVYFPQCRAAFARADVFNTKNDAQRNTYDDLFAQRMFSSYIHKESNVVDREIAYYANGVEALLESDRVKDDVFRTEHDVWQF